MTLGILGKKLGMTQLFQEDGSCVPVTVLQMGPCKVLQVKTVAASELPESHRTAAASRGKKRGKVERPRRPDGYYAVQLGFDPKPGKSASKAELGHAKRAGCEEAMRFVREFRLDAAPELKAGDDVTLGEFGDAQRVDVVGTTKGRGWAGTIKRWGFQRQRMSHGNSKNHRRPGGLGRQYSTHHGVPKNKKMAGHYGVERVTVQNLQVVKVDPERNLMYVRGAVPGHRQSYVMVKRTVKAS